VPVRWHQTGTLGSTAHPPINRGAVPCRATWGREWPSELTTSKIDGSSDCQNRRFSALLNIFWLVRWGSIGKPAFLAFCKDCTAQRHAPPRVTFPRMSARAVSHARLSNDIRI
jgi:hypothetical protein